MSLTGLWLPSDIRNRMDQLLANAKGTDSEIGACASKLDSTSKAAWGEFLVAVQKFCAQQPVWFFPTGSNEVVTDGALADQLEAYERELLQWQRRLVGLGCKSITVIDTTAPNKVLTPELLTALKWAAVGVGAFSIAYGVGKVADTLQYYRGTSVYRKELRDTRRERRRLVRRIR